MWITKLKSYLTHHFAPILHHSCWHIWAMFKIFKEKWSKNSCHDKLNFIDNDSYCIGIKKQSLPFPAASSISTRRKSTLHLSTTIAIITVNINVQNIFISIDSLNYFKNCELFVKKLTVVQISVENVEWFLQGKFSAFIQWIEAMFINIFV